MKNHIENNICALNIGLIKKNYGTKSHKQKNVVSRMQHLYTHFESHFERNFKAKDFNALQFI